MITMHVWTDLEEEFGEYEGHRAVCGQLWGEGESGHWHYFYVKRDWSKIKQRHETYLVCKKCDKHKSKRLIFKQTINL